MLGDHFYAIKQSNNEPAAPEDRADSVAYQDS